MPKEIPLTMGYVAIVDDEDYDDLMRFKWGASPRGITVCYATRKLKRVKGRRGVMYMHRYILQAPDGMQVDHINHNGLDNRKANLRLATPAQNLMNRTVTSKNKSGFKGVHWCKRDEAWVAQIRIAGRGKTLGYFPTKESAAVAYDRAALQYHGEFASLNGAKSVMEAK